MLTLEQLCEGNYYHHLFLKSTPDAGSFAKANCGKLFFSVLINFCFVFELECGQTVLKRSAVLTRPVSNDADCPGIKSFLFHLCPFSQQEQRLSNYVNVRVQISFYVV